MNKTILFILLLSLTAVSGFAQQTPSRFVFKFVHPKDMFYIPWQGNGEELERLFDVVEQYKTQIKSGQIPVHVDGYCANLKTAAVRASRVKSELITHKGLIESNFITGIYASAFEGKKDVVVVSFIIPAAVQSQPKTQPTVTQQPKQPEGASTPQPADELPFAQEQPATPSPVERAGRAVSLRTNLLYWAFATPNLGLEWKPTNSVGILINGAYSHYIWNDKENHHRTWLIQPEIRWYLGANKKWFVGLEGHAAQFNFKFRDTGYQGDVIGGGLTGGYCLQLSRYLDMDFSLGLGYTNLKYETYTRSNGVSVLKEGNLKKNVFVPTQAGVSLIWKLK